MEDGHRSAGQSANARALTGGCDSFSWTPWNNTGGQWVYPPSLAADSSIAFLGPDGALTVRLESGQGITGNRLETLNGNYVDFTYGVFEDTLGRSVGNSWNVGDPGEHYALYTINDSDGNPQTYRLNYEDCHLIHNPIGDTAGCLNYLLTSIVLPNSLGSYVFEYGHDQGFLTKITLPSGAYIEYAYHGGNSDHDPEHNYVETRTVTNGMDVKTWTYARAESMGIRTVTVTDPDDHLISHTFNASGFEEETVWKTDAMAMSPSQTVLATRDSVGRPYTIVTQIDGVEQKQEFYWVSFRLFSLSQSDWYPTNGTVAKLTKTNYDYAIGCPSEPCNLTFPSSIELQKWDGSAYVAQGKTEFGYNEYSLASVSGTVPHYQSPAFHRWNVTTIKRYYDATHYLSEHFHYDVVGNVVEHVDSRGKSTLFSFADNYSDSMNRNSYAYPTLVTNAEGHEAAMSYNYDTGLVTSLTDARGLETTFSYDPIDRPLSVTEPNGSVVSYDYTDGATPTLVEESTVAMGQERKIETTFDLLHRPIQTKQYDPAGDVTVEAQYDAYGRVTQVSTPHRGGTAVWTITEYDDLGRVVRVTNPDSTTAGFVYMDNTLTITDEAGHQRRETRNTLGQLTQVDEPNPTLANPQATTYSYYVFGPIAGVTQGSQTRTFTADWLGRLTAEEHPETVSTAYTYDGPLVATRTVARSMTTSVTTTYTYDDIGRLLTTSYDDMVTPTVTRVYDDGDEFGLLTSVTDGAGSTTYTYKSDSALLDSEARTFTGVTGPFTTSYDYDLEGKITSITYPSGRTVSRTYAANAGITAGQLDTLSDDETSTTLLDGIQDNAAGLITERTLGNGAVETRSFNSRFQMTGIEVEKSSLPVMDIAYGFGTSTNNGSILSRTDNIQAEHSASYTYDSVQRLSQVTNPNWSITWAFDRYGNRTSQTSSGLASSVGAQTLSYAGNNNKNSDWTYDYAGNVTHDGTGGHYYTYDGENRIIQIDSSAIQYAYDGEGRRVFKWTDPVATYYLYGQTGLMSEFTTTDTGTETADSTDRLEYRIGEQTGTAVLLMNPSGTVIGNSRVFPYGELWSTPAFSTIEQNFTTYSRDGESGLDYAMARYFASRSGRFMSPDPGHVGASPNDPQSWNVYSYAGNDPINFIDPDGLEAVRIPCPRAHPPT